ncbi:hypothetical protein BDZ89DRAFT_1070142 [Hymenopellis radicata]|nr:hypothetical protein BDZ89DRAFT_1070142 [Hymenopellis radicata]
MVLESIRDRYKQLDKSQRALDTPPVVPANRGDLLLILRTLVQESSRQSRDVTIDSNKFYYKWRDLNKCVRASHACPDGVPTVKRARCQGPRCSAALDEFGKWDSRWAQII